MSWIGADARFRLLVLICLAFLSCAPLAAQEIPAPGDSEIWLVTYGPGEIYWQRFGHNAIWVRDRSRNLDHTFNFGFFDFQQEDFFLRFLQGRMLYFSAAQPAMEEFAAYIAENRSIRAQKLNLTGPQKAALTDHLLWVTAPANREYLYDYYTDNCSTRVRDAIDLALGGAMRRQLAPQSAELSWRDHTRRLTQSDFWLYLGLEIVLGAPVDQPISRWDELFIPGRMSEIMEDMQIPTGNGPAALVRDSRSLYESDLPLPPSSPDAVWPRYLLASLLVVAGAALLGRWWSMRGPARVWLALTGLAGLALVFFWLGTDHSAASLNLNLLVFNPLWLLAVFRSVRGNAVFWLVAGFSILALVMFWLPPWQYTADVLAAFIPLNLAAAVALRRPPRSN